MSIPTAFNTINEQSGIAVTHDFDTKAENMHVLYYIARNQLYSDEILAVLREYGINAMDIHIQTGQAERPIRVTLPTMLDSFLKVRDFGTGLDNEGIKEYVSFGASSKRGDPLQTGQLGIGCKCGFTYGESFLVSSYMKGVLTVWNAYIDPSNKGKISQMAQSPTDEPDGIEVIIPIKACDVDKTHEKAMFFYSFSKVTPEFVNATPGDIEKLEAHRNSKPTYKGEGWRYMGKGTSYAIMGNIPYPLNLSSFSDSEIRPEVKHLINGGLIIEVKLDELDFAASREQLKYTTKTKKNLAARLTDVVTELTKQCSSTFDGCKTLWEARHLYKSVFDFYGPLYNLRSLFYRNLTFKGYVVNGESFSTLLNNGDTGANCNVYARIGNTCEGRAAFNILSSPKHLIVINDTGICNGIVNRVVGKIEGPDRYEKVYVLSFANDIVKAQWLAESGFDYPWISLSSLPKETLSKYYTSSSPTRCALNPKHLSQEFVYKDSAVNRYGAARSEYWEVADVDLKKEEGVYVSLERFSFDSSGGNTYVLHPSVLQSMLSEVANMGITVPSKVYGIKSSSRQAALSNPKMVSFKVWRERAVREYIKAHPELEKQVADYRYYYKLKERVANLHNIVEVIRQWKSLPENHALVSFAKKVKELSLCGTSKVGKIIELTDTVCYICTATASYNVDDDIDALRFRYPMFFKLAAMTYQITYKPEENNSWAQLLEEYVTMVDLMTP